MEAFVAVKWFVRIKMRTFSMRSMYLLDSMHAVISKVIVLGQTDHYCEWSVRYSYGIVFSLHSADTFLKQ